MPCRTWDNATLFCEAECAANRARVPIDYQDATDRTRGEKHLVFGGSRDIRVRQVQHQEPASSGIA